MRCKMVICFFKQKTAYEMRISDWSSDVCSSDLEGAINVPMGDQVTFRVSGLYQRQSDYVDNVLPSGTEENALGGYEDFALRFQAEVRPSDNLEILLSGQIRDLDGTARLFRANNFPRGEEGLNENFSHRTISTAGQKQRKSVVSVKSVSVHGDLWVPR